MSKSPENKQHLSNLLTHSELHNLPPQITQLLLALLVALSSFGVSVDTASANTRGDAKPDLVDVQHHELPVAEPDIDNFNPLIMRLNDKTVMITVTNPHDLHGSITFSTTGEDTPVTSCIVNFEANAVGSSATCTLDGVTLNQIIEAVVVLHDITDNGIPIVITYQRFFNPDDPQYVAQRLNLPLIVNDTAQLSEEQRAIEQTQSPDVIINGVSIGVDDYTADATFIRCDQINQNANSLVVVRDNLGNVYGPYTFPESNFIRFPVNKFATELNFIVTNENGKSEQNDISVLNTEAYTNWQYLPFATDIDNT